MVILLLLALSICVGMLCQKCKFFGHMGKVATWTVRILILVFGITLGSNDAIVHDFGRLGLTALILGLAGVGGSVLAAWAIDKYLTKNRKQ